MAYMRIAGVLCGAIALLGAALIEGVEPSMRDSPQHADVLRYLQHPRVRALLDTIAFAEGTDQVLATALPPVEGLDLHHPRGYRTIFGYDYFNSYDDHPRRIICMEYKGSWLCSSAAGRYQFLRKTWDYYMCDRGVCAQHGDTSFSPLNQDRVAVHIFIDHGVISMLLSDPCPLDEVLRKLNAVWASLPGSPYGQPIRNLEELRRVFNQQVQVYQRKQGVRG